MKHGLSTTGTQIGGFYKHAQVQPKKGVAYKKKCVIYLFWPHCKPGHWRQTTGKRRLVLSTFLNGFCSQLLKEKFRSAVLPKIPMNFDMMSYVVLFWRKEFLQL